MLWFNGSIKNAVDKVKSSDSFFLVFVQGNDKLSEKYEAYLNEEAVFKLNDYVAVKIPDNSLAFQQFKQIYVSVPVPSIFLIQNNGIPLKVVSSTDVSEVRSTITDTMKKQKLKSEKKENMYPNNKSLTRKSITKEDSSAEVSHIQSIGRRLFDVSEDELKTRIREIRAFPKFLLIDSSKSCHSSSSSGSCSKSQSARIQFRLPNNSMPSWEFPDKSTLRDVKAYLMEKVKLSPNFKLLRTYPRYAFSREDEKKTLAALSLTPNAILIVVPYEDKTVQAKVIDLLAHQTFLSTLLSVLLKPLFGLFSYFKMQFLRRRPVDENSDKFSKVKRFDRTEQGDAERNSRGKTVEKRIKEKREKQDTIKKKVLTPGSNIHGFKFDDDTDTDTEHPDNGNSTQQRFQ